MELVLSLGYKSGEQITQLHKLSDRLFIPHLHRESIRLQFPTSGIRVAPSLHLSFRLLGLGSVSATWHVIYPYQNCSTDYTQQSHHGKIIVAYQANKRHAYEIRRFVAVLTTAHHWTLFCYTQIQSTPQHITSLRFLLLYRPACPLLWFRNHKHFLWTGTNCDNFSLRIFFHHTVASSVSVLNIFLKTLFSNVHTKQQANPEKERYYISVDHSILVMF